MGVTDPNRIYTLEEMAKGDVMFAATGVTSGPMLRGVRRFGARRDHAFHRHALQVRHRPLRRGPPQLRAEAVGLRGLGAWTRFPTARSWASRAVCHRPALGLAARARRARALASPSAWALPELVGRLLAARGIGIEAAARLPGADAARAAARPFRACATWTRRRSGWPMRCSAARRSAVFGDYDVDGACQRRADGARCCASSAAACTHYVPDRLTEGYGPNAAGASPRSASAAPR